MHSKPLFVNVHQERVTSASKSARDAYGKLAPKGEGNSNHGKQQQLRLGVGYLVYDFSEKHSLLASKQHKAAWAIWRTNQPTSCICLLIAAPPHAGVGH